MHIVYDYIKYNIKVNKLVFKTQILKSKEWGLITATKVRKLGAVARYSDMI